MLNLFRRIHCPENLNFGMPLIKRNTFSYIHQHDEIIRLAELEASRIVRQAEEQASEIRERARMEICKEVKEDLLTLKDLMDRSHQQLIDNTAALCTEICEVALQRLLGSIDPRIKIELMVRELLDISYGVRELVILCNPIQSALLKDSMASIMSSILSYRRWKVQEDESIGELELRIACENGSEVQVSIENILATFSQEIKCSVNESSTSGTLETTG